MKGKVQRLDFNGSSNLGAFCCVTSHWTLHAVSNEPTKSALEAIFERSTFETTIGHSTLIGILSAGNVNGLLVPHITLDEELESLNEVLDRTVVPLESRLTALGNLILTNDQAALVSTEFTSAERKVIQDTLGVEVVARQLNDSDLVGSYCVVTNHGLLAHNDISDEELEWLETLFKVHAEIGTVNCGIPYISIGLLATDRAVAAGFETTGPELMRITEAFFS